MLARGQVLLGPSPPSMTWVILLSGTVALVVATWVMRLRGRRWRSPGWHPPSPALAAVAGRGVVAGLGHVELATRARPRLFFTPQRASASQGEAIL